MKPLAGDTTHTTLWQDYVHTQFDPAHLLSELGFTLVFEVVQLVLIALLWHKVVKPYLDRRHKQFDADHGLAHHDEVDALVESRPTRKET